MYFIGFHSFSFARKLLTESSCYEENGQPLIGNMWCFCSFPFIFPPSVRSSFSEVFLLRKNELQLYNKGIKKNDWCEPFSQWRFVFPLGLRTIDVSYWIESYTVCFTYFFWVFIVFIFLFFKFVFLIFMYIIIIIINVNIFFVYL